MAKPQKKPKKPGPLDDLKEEIAEDLGLMEKVREKGWAGLTAAESGKVGGLMTRRLRAGPHGREDPSSRGRAGQGNPRGKGI
ncbi:MAG: small, acid-soluble spore protein, alpha/beta type [Bacillota bacterium]